MKRIFFLVILTAMISCKKVAVDKKIELQKEGKFEIILEKFSSFPTEIDGCSCYFSKDSVGFKKEEYIFVNDFAQTAFLKINGKFVKFIQINKITNGAKYQSDEYEMNLEIKKGKETGEETTLQTGKIKLKDKKGNLIETDFFGECGC